MLKYQYACISFHFETRLDNSFKYPQDRSCDEVHNFQFLSRQCIRWIRTDSLTSRSTVEGLKFFAGLLLKQSKLPFAAAIKAPDRHIPCSAKKSMKY